MKQSLLQCQERVVYVETIRLKIKGNVVAYQLQYDATQS